MSFFNSSNILRFMAVVALIMVAANVVDVYTGNGKPGQSREAFRQSAPAQPDAEKSGETKWDPETHFEVSVDAGSLQDDGLRLVPLDKIWLERIKERYEKSSGNSLEYPHIVTGRVFYSGMGPWFDWAVVMELKSPYKTYMPVFEVSSWIDENMEYAAQELDYLDGEAAASVLDKSYRQYSYASIFLRLGALSLVMQNPLPAEALCPRALNGLFPALDAGRGELTFQAILETAAKLPEDVGALLENGRALNNRALVSQSPEREKLFAEALEKLRSAHEKEPENLEAVYALAVAAAGNKDEKLAEQMLRLAASLGDSISCSVVLSEPAFKDYAGKPWFMDAAKLFYGECEAAASGEELEKWLADRLAEATPKNGPAPGAVYSTTARNLIDSALHKLSPEADKLVIKEVDKLFALAAKENNPPLGVDDYFFWISVLQSYPGDCETENIELRRKALELGKAGFALDKSNAEMLRYVFYSFAGLATCLNEDELPGLVAEGWKTVGEFEAKDVFAAVRLHDSWTHHLIATARQSTPEARKILLKDVFSLLEKDREKAEAEGDTRAQYYTQFALAERKLAASSLFGSPEEAHKMLDEAVVHAEKVQRLLKSSKRPFGPVSQDAFLLGDLAANLAHSPEKAVKLARASLGILSSDGVDFENTEVLVSMAASLRVLGVNEIDPELKREAFFVGATLAMRAALAEPERPHLWNMWALLLCALSDANPPEAKELPMELAQKIFLNMEAAYPGAESYNLGCLEALRGNPEKAREWLERARDFGTMPSRLHLLEDPDMDSLRGLPWFEEILPEK